MKTRRLVLTLEIESDLPLKAFKKIREIIILSQNHDMGIVVHQSQVNVIKD